MLNAIQYLSETTGRRYFPQRGYVNTQRIPRIPFYPTKTLSLLTWSRMQKRRARIQKRGEQKRTRKGSRRGRGRKGGGERKRVARGGSFRDHRARDPTALKGSPTSFSKRGIGARFGLPFWNATRKQHATRSKVARTRVQACASRAERRFGAEPTPPL